MGGDSILHPGRLLRGAEFAALFRATCWRNSATRKVWDGERPNQFRGLDFEAAIDLLLALSVAKSLGDLSPLKHRTAQAQGRSAGTMVDDDQRPLAYLFRIPQGRRLRR
jgi:hypothetical protein